MLTMRAEVPLSSFAAAQDDRGTPARLSNTRTAGDVSTPGVHHVPSDQVMIVGTFDVSSSFTSFWTSSEIVWRNRAWIVSS
jgi:hypothetical protein